MPAKLVWQLKKYELLAYMQVTCLTDASRQQMNI